MAKFNTQNKLGSTDPRDLLDNSQIADDYVNNKLVESVPDRFGVLRKTWFGMESIFTRLIALFKSRGDAAISAIGWQELGDWSVGLSLTDRRQIVLYNGAWYKYLGELNHTITGDSPSNDGGIWSIDNPSGTWANIGDAALRNELASESDSSGGSLVHLSQRGTVQDAIGKVVTLESFGVYLQSADIIKAGAAIDMSDKFQAAVNHAKELGTKLVCTQGIAVGPSANYFIYIEKDIDITGLLETVGTLCFGYLGSKFTPRFATADSPARHPVFRNMNATYDSATGKQYFGTTSGFQRLDAIQVSCLDGNSPSSYIGQDHTTAYTHFRGDLVGRRCPTAIRLANCYDCSFSGQIYAIDSGTIDYYPFEVGSYPAYDKVDESNSMTLPNVILHTNKYRDASIIGSKINLSRVHCEASTIPSIDGLVPNNIDKLTPTGIASFVFGSVGGYAGNIDIQPDDNSPVVGTCLINMMNTEVGTIHGSSKIHVQLSDIFYLGMGGTASSVYTIGDTTLDGGSAVHIKKLICKGNLTPSNASAIIEYAAVVGNIVGNSAKINKGTCGGTYSQTQYGELHNFIVTGAALLASSSRIFDTVFNGPFTNSSPNGRLVRCTFNGTFSNTGVGYFDDCNLPSSFALENGNYYKCSIPTILRAKSSSSVKGTLDRCVIGGLGITGNAAASVFIKGCDIGTNSGQIDLSNNTGYVILDPQCRVTGNATAITGWAQPTSTAAGYGVETINPYTGTGWRLLYNGNAPYWAPVKKYTS